MSDWNCSTAEERILLWRNLRNQLRDCNEEELLNKTAELFAAVPVSIRCIDFYTPESWPTPWEILYHKLFCANSVSLLIYYTLSLTMDENRVSIVLIEDDRDRFLVPIIDKKYILNYVLGEISTFDDFPQIRIIDSFEDEDIYSPK